MKKLFLILTIAAIATAAQAQRQTFNLPAYFSTNVFLSDNTNTPLHTRIANAEATNAAGWSAFAATGDVDMDGNDIAGIGHLNLEANGSIRWGTGDAAARPQIADGGGHLVFMATNKIIFSNDVIVAGSIDMDENSITNVDTLAGFGREIDFDAGTISGFAIDAGVTNIGFGLTGDGHEVPLAVDTNSVVTTGVLVAALSPYKTNSADWSLSPALTNVTFDTNLLVVASLGVVPATTNSQYVAFNVGSRDHFLRAKQLTSLTADLEFRAGPSEGTWYRLWHSGNFSGSSFLSVSAAQAGYWRITTAPTGATAFGSSGQMAVSGTNLFIYSENALGTGTGRWGRLNLEVAW